MSVVISSSRNTKIVALRKLSQRKHRRQQARFAVEGLQLLGMALSAGHQPLEVFYCTEHLHSHHAERLLNEMTAADTPAHALSPRLMESLSERDTPQGLIATFPLFHTPLDVALTTPARIPAESIPPTARLIIIVDRLQDPGNLGTIIRTADAVGAQAVILLEPTVDPFDPKTVRGTMGSLFTVPLVSIDDLEPLFDLLHQQDYRIAGADGYQGHIPWQMADSLSEPLEKMALILGNEARGLSDDLHPHITHWLRLPMFGDAESLNVAVAGGVLMYHWLAQNWRGEA